MQTDWQLRWSAEKAEWREEEHPRDERGRFTEKPDSEKDELRYGLRMAGESEYIKDISRAWAEAVADSEKAGGSALELLERNKNTMERIVSSAFIGEDISLEMCNAIARGLLLSIRQALGDKVEIRGSYPVGNGHLTLNATNPENGRSLAMGVIIGRAALQGLGVEPEDIGSAADRLHRAKYVSDEEFVGLIHRVLGYSGPSIHDLRDRSIAAALRQNEFSREERALLEGGGAVLYYNPLDKSTPIRIFASSEGAIKNAARDLVGIVQADLDPEDIVKVLLPDWAPLVREGIASGEIASNFVEALTGRYPDKAAAARSVLWRYARMLTWRLSPEEGRKMFLDILPPFSTREIDDYMAQNPELVDAMSYLRNYMAHHFFMTMGQGRGSKDFFSAILKGRPSDAEATETLDALITVLHAHRQEDAPFDSSNPEFVRGFEAFKRLSTDSRSNMVYQAVRDYVYPIFFLGKKETIERAVNQVLRPMMESDTCIRFFLYDPSARVYLNDDANISSDRMNKMLAKRTQFIVVDNNGVGQSAPATASDILAKVFAESDRPLVERAIKDYDGWYDNDERAALWSWMNVKPGGQGLGSVLVPALVTTLREGGIKHIFFHAATDPTSGVNGAASWASMGADWLEPKHRNQAILRLIDRALDYDISRELLREVDWAKIKTPRDLFELKLSDGTPLGKWYLSGKFGPTSWYGRIKIA